MSFEGHTAAQLGNRIGAARCVVMIRVTSTLDVIHELAADNWPDGTVVLAEEQVQGRGTRGRSWISPPGSGIWLGYLFRTDRPPTGVLAIRVGLELVAVLSSLGIEARVKWPNDIMIEDRKAAGILCEARTVGDSGWIAIGVGVNVYGPLSPEVAKIAACLDQVAPHLTRIDVLERLIPRMRNLPDLPELTDDEMTEFSRHDWLRTREVSEPLAGTVVGIDREGALEVEGTVGKDRAFGGTVVLV